MCFLINFWREQRPLTPGNAIDDLPKAARNIRKPSSLYAISNLPLLEKSMLSVMSLDAAAADEEERTRQAIEGTSNSSFGENTVRRLFFRYRTYFFPFRSVD